MDDADRLVPKERIEAWRNVTRLLELFIGAVGELYAELCLRAYQPELGIKHEVENNFQVFIVVLAKVGLDQHRVHDLVSLAELFACEVRFTGEGQDMISITYYGFKTIDEKLNDPGTEQSEAPEPPPAADASADADNTADDRPETDDDSSGSDTGQS